MRIAVTGGNGFIGNITVLIKEKNKIIHLYRSKNKHASVKNVKFDISKIKKFISRNWITRLFNSPTWDNLNNYKK